MNETETPQENKIYDDEIDLLKLINIFWKKKFLIIFITVIGGFSSIYYSLSLPNIYTSSALLTATSNNESSQGMLSRYSGMASLAGISLPSSGTKNKTVEAIARINSLEFFEKFFLPNILIQDLLAVESWEPQPNKVIYDPEIFDSSSNKWVRKVSFPLTTIPSSQEAYKTYKKIMSISQDNKTSFITLSIKHKSPYIAQTWVETIISEINKSMRDDDKNKATRSIDFLNKQISKVNYDEVKKSISSLQQDQMKSLMLIEANEDYIFSALNSAIVPELKSEPKRSRIVIFWTFISFILSLLLVVILDFRKLFSQ